MNKIYACIALIVIGIIAVIYGLWPSPPPNTVFPVAKKQAEKRVEVAEKKVEKTAAGVADAKKITASAAAKVEPLKKAVELADANIGAETSQTPLQSRFDDVLASAVALRNENTALRAEVEIQKVEILAHEAHETALSEVVDAQADEIAILEVRIGAQDATIATLERKAFFARWGLGGVVVGVAVILLLPHFGFSLVL